MHLIYSKWLWLKSKFSHHTKELRTRSISGVVFLDVEIGCGSWILEILNQKHTFWKEKIGININQTKIYRFDWGFFFVDAAGAEKKVVTMAQHFYPGIGMEHGTGAILFGGISYQQPVELRALRGGGPAHTEKCGRHRNRTSRPFAGHS